MNCVCGHFEFCKVCSPGLVKAFAKKKSKPYLKHSEIAKRVLKSKRNTVFTNSEQVLNTLEILDRMGVLRATKDKK